MPTIRNPGDRSAIRERLTGVTPTQSGRWGVMNVHQMICHVSDALRIALGEIPAVSNRSLMGRTLIRLVVIQTGVKPPPGRVKAPPETRTTKPGNWDADMAACHDLIERTAAARRLEPHPFFGNLSVDEWGKLMWKHLDHHLRQFGA